VAHGHVPKALFHGQSFRTTIIKSSLHNEPQPGQVTVENHASNTIFCRKRASVTAVEWIGFALWEIRAMLHKRPCWHRAA